VSGANAQHGVARGDGFQHIPRAVAILNSGAVNLDPDQQSARVGDDMALSPLDPLARIIPANPATFRGFYALAVDNPGCRLGFATLRQARGFNQLAVHLIERAIIAPRTVDTGGKSLGSMRHWQPVVAT
jgi:hypothetical protein